MTPTSSSKNAANPAAPTPRTNLHDEIVGALSFVIEERKPGYLSDTVQGLIAAGEFAKAASYIQSAVLAYLLPMVTAGEVPHGPKGECPEPELCSALIEARATGSGGLLRAAAQAVVDEVDRNHDTKEAPARYIVPWAAVTNLRQALVRLQVAESEEEG